MSTAGYQTNTDGVPNNALEEVESLTSLQIVSADDIATHSGPDDAHGIISIPTDTVHSYSPQSSSVDSLIIIAIDSSPLHISSASNSELSRKSSVEDDDEHPGGNTGPDQNPSAFGEIVLMFPLERTYLLDRFLDETPADGSNVAARIMNRDWVCPNTDLQIDEDETTVN